MLIVIMLKLLKLGLSEYPIRKIYFWVFKLNSSKNSGFDISWEHYRHLYEQMNPPSAFLGGGGGCTVRFASL